MKRPELHSEIRYHIPYDVKLNDNFMDRSAHKLYALTSRCGLICRESFENVVTPRELTYYHFL